NFSHFCIARPDTVTTIVVLSQCPVSVLALWIGAQATGTASPPVALPVPDPYCRAAAAMSLYGLLRNWFWRGGAAGSTAPRRPARGRGGWCWLRGPGPPGPEGEGLGGDV